MIKRKTESQTAVVETKQQGTQKEPEQTNSESQTPQPPQQYDISQGDAPMDVEPPHVEDRRAQLSEQEKRGTDTSQRTRTNGCRATTKTFV